LGLEWPEVEKKGAQELHIFSHNRDHVYKSQMDIQIWFHLWKWKICLFKNHLHSGLTRINPKTIRICSKWEKLCLNVTRAREPTCISQMGIKKLFYIYKPIITHFINSLHSKLVKLGLRMIESWDKAAQERYLFAHKDDHVYNPQMGIQTWLSYFQMKNFAFQKSPSFGVKYLQMQNFAFQKPPWFCINQNQP